LAPQTGWRIWNFPSPGVFWTFSEFERSTGWFSFFVEDMDSGCRYPLGTRNILYGERPTLTVTSTGDTGNPFKADFAKEE
jgi:hypothetical protein